MNISSSCSYMWLVPCMEHIQWKGVSVYALLDAWFTRWLCKVISTRFSWRVLPYLGQATSVSCCNIRFRLDYIHSRPNGCPKMTWCRTLNKALKCKGLPVNFKEWRAIAEDWSEWRSRTYSKPMPLSENWSYRVHESKDEHCITQKDTQPSQTCSGGFINT